jgi:hypothetical protein
LYVTPATFCHFGHCFDNRPFCLKNHVIRVVDLVEANICGSTVAWSFQLLFCVDSAGKFGDFVVKIHVLWTEV